MANPYRDKKGQFASGGSGGKGAAKSNEKKPINLEREQQQIFRDRKNAKRAASTTSYIYPKDGSVRGWAKGGGTPEANKKIRDSEAASVRKIRKDTAAKAAKLGLTTRAPKPVPSRNAMLLAKSITAKPRKPRKSKKSAKRSK